MSFRYSLKVALLWRFIVVSTVPILVVGLLAFRVFTEGITEHMHTDNEMIARSVARLVEAELREAQLNLQQILKILPNQDVSEQGIDSLLDHLVAGSPYLDTLYLADGQGRLIALGLPPGYRNRRGDLLARDTTELPFLHVPLRPGRPVWTDASLSPLTGESALTIVIPYTNRILAAHYALAHLFDTIRSVAESEELMIWILNSRGFRVFDTREAAPGSPIDLRDLRPVQEGLAGNEETYRFDFDGRRYLGSVSRASEVGWLALVSKRAEVVSAVVSGMCRISIPVMMITILAGIVAASSLAFRLNRPLAQLAYSATSVAAGSYEVSIPPQRHLETEAVARSLRNMVQAIQQRETTLKTLAQGMAASTGTDWLQSVVSDTCLYLHADTVLVGRLEGKEHIRAIAMIQQGRFRPDYESPLDGTIYELTLREGYVLIPEATYTLYPKQRELREMGVQGFTGLALRDKSGTPLGVLAVMSRNKLVLPEQGREVLTIIAARAATEIERIRAEEDRARLEEQLQQSMKMEALGRLAGGVAHDFNNLLQVISGYASVLIEEQWADDSKEEKLQEILQAADRATSLVRQLLVFSRKSPLEQKRISLNEVIDKLLEMLSRLIGERMELTVAPGTDLPAIFADRGQVEQVLLNLCVNARDATPQAGHIRISTGLIHFSEEFLGDHPWARQNDYVVLEVADIGIGMTEEEQERIFDPFFTTKEVGKGTGLGLAMVYAIVKHHSGEIEVESEPGKGSTFRIFFPALNSSSLEHTDDREAGREDLNGSGTILLAEDEDTVRDLTTLVLKKAGYTVLPAGQGEEALELFRANSSVIDMVILDVVMPRLGGREVYETIKAERSHLPVLFCSGYSNHELDTVSAIDPDYAVIQKPYRPEVLLRKVKQVVGSSVGIGEKRALSR